MSNPTCSIPGCDKPRRSSGAEWCKMHYHRWYRHGSPLTVASKSGVTASLGRRYRTVAAKGHPMAMKNGRAYEHRKVLFDAIGLGPHACHWCGTSVDWLPKGDPMELHVDHLNNDGSDNRSENLAPSCRTCNAARGVQRRSKALKDAGFWSHHDTIARTGRGRREAIEQEAA